jgi:hypothetical protein
MGTHYAPSQCMPLIPLISYLEIKVNYLPSIKLKSNFNSHDTMTVTLTRNGCLKYQVVRLLLIIYCHYISFTEDSEQLTRRCVCPCNFHVTVPRN